MDKSEIMARCSQEFWALAPDKSGNTANLYIYTDVKANRTDWFGKEIKSETSAQTFRQKLDEMGDVSQINIYINSNGGSVFEGLGIYSQLKRHKAHKTVYIDGVAASIASVIAMAGDEVVMSNPATMMVHTAWSVVAGNADELRKQADVLDKLTDSLKQAYLLRSGGKISEEKLTELIYAETWLTAKECIEYGFADRLVEEIVTGQKKEKPADDGGADDDKSDSTGFDPQGKSKEKEETFTEKAMSIIGEFF